MDEPSYLPHSIYSKACNPCSILKVKYNKCEVNTNFYNWLKWLIVSSKKKLWFYVKSGQKVSITHSVWLSCIVKLCMKLTHLRFIKIVMGHIYLFGFYAMAEPHKRVGGQGPPKFKKKNHFIVCILFTF